MSQELAKADTSLKGIINSDAMREQFGRALPKHLTPERFARIAITALTRTPKLQECSRESVMKCLLDLSAMGIEPDGRRAHLIPYGKECTLVVDYKGIVDLVRRDPNVEDVQCITIREKDEAEWVNGEMTHKIDPKVDRGEVVCTYTRIKWKTGSVSIGEPFSKADAEHAKKSSKSAASGPWKDHYTEMWKKSNIKRDSKMWPLSPEIRDALEKEDDHFVGGMKNVTRREMPAILPIAAPVVAATQEVEVTTEQPAVDLWEEEKP